MFPGAVCIGSAVQQLGLSKNKTLWNAGYIHKIFIYPSYFSLKQPQLYQNLLTALEIASSGSICSHVSIYVKAWPDTQLHPMAALVFHICRSRTIRRPLAAALVRNLSKAWQKSGSWIFYTLHLAKLEEKNDTMISQNNLSNASPKAAGGAFGCAPVSWMNWVQALSPRLINCMLWCFFLFFFFFRVKEWYDEILWRYIMIEYTV